MSPRQIDATGVTCLRGVVSNDWLTDARMGVAAYFSRSSAHELLRERVATGRGTSFADRLVGDHRLRPLLQSVVSAAGMAGRADTGFQADLRLVNGPGPEREAPGFSLRRVGAQHGDPDRNARCRTGAPRRTDSVCRTGGRIGARS